MNTLSVRFSEQATRPMGYAVITVDGIPRTLETVELALSRHGYGANNLGPDGWQGAECWLQPEEAWYGDGSLKCVIGPELVYQLENMPYTLALRGEGLAETATMTFVWPLELELEETSTGEREPVGGTRVHPAPSRRAAIGAAVESSPAEIELPQLAEAEVGIPELDIPDYGVATPEAKEEQSAVPEPETEPAVKPNSPPAEMPSPQAPAPESEQQSTASPCPPSEPQEQQRPEPDAAPVAAPAPKQPAADASETVTLKARGTGKLIAATALLGVVVVAVAGWWLWPRQGPDLAETEANQAAAPAPQAAPTAQTAPAAQLQPDSLPSVAPEPRIVSTPPAPEPRPVSAPPAPEPGPVVTPPDPELESMPRAGVSRSAPVMLETAPAPSRVPVPDDETVTSTPTPPAQVSTPRRTTVDENLEAELESQFDGNLEATLESMLNKETRQ